MYHGSEYEGYNNPIFGTPDGGETIYGLSAEVCQQMFLKHFRKVVNKEKVTMIDNN